MSRDSNEYIDRIHQLEAEVAMLRASQRAADDRAQMRSDELDRVTDALAALERKAWAYLNHREHPEFDADWVDHPIQWAQVADNRRRETEADLAAHTARWEMLLAWLGVDYGYANATAGAVMKTVSDKMRALDAGSGPAQSGKETA